MLILSQRNIKIKELSSTPFPETSKALPIAMLRAREALMISFRPILAKHGFTEQQWRVLRVLGEKGPSDAGQVAFDACILAPSLSRIIGKLEKEKYISRFVDQKDGRRVNLVLTPLGEETLKKIVPDMDVVYKNIKSVTVRKSLLNYLNYLGA